MPGPHELPKSFLAGDRVGPHLRFTGVKIEGPRLRVQRVTDDQGADLVCDPFRPELLAVFATQGRDSPGIHLAGKELLPVMPVNIYAKERDHPVVIHQGLVPASAGALAEAGVQIKRFFPQHVAGLGIQSHHPRDLGLGLGLAQHGPVLLTMT